MASTQKITRNDNVCTMHLSNNIGCVKQSKFHGMGGSTWRPTQGTNFKNNSVSSPEIAQFQDDSIKLDYKKVMKNVDRLHNYERIFKEEEDDPHSKTVKKTPA